MLPECGEEGLADGGEGDRATAKLQAERKHEMLGFPGMREAAEGSGAHCASAVRADPERS